MWITFVIIVIVIVINQFYPQQFKIQETAGLSHGREESNRGAILAASTSVDQGSDKGNQL